VALDKSPEDPRPFIEAAGARHPSLIDTEHRVADLYGMINVPTAVWIDERGRIVRPNDALFGNDDLVQFHGIESGPRLDAIRRWVKDGVLPLDDDGVRRFQVPPTAEQQLARAEFALAWYLHQRGDAAAAERHFVRAGELAPLDLTIRRGSMPIRGLDPMGPDFADLYAEWVQAGMPYYGAIPTGEGT